MALLLTGALHGTRNEIANYLLTFKRYDWLWKEDKDVELSKKVLR